MQYDTSKRPSIIFKQNRNSHKKTKKIVTKFKFIFSSRFYYQHLNIPRQSKIKSRVNFRSIIQFSTIPKL